MTLPVVVGVDMSEGRVDEKVLEAVADDDDVQVNKNDSSGA